MQSQELKPEQTATAGAASSFITPPAPTSMPDWYPELLASVSKEVGAGRSRAISAANKALLASYWSIGRQLAQRESEQGWGSKVVTRLSADVQARFPGSPVPGDSRHGTSAT